jgi:hypothetical protein
MLPHVRVPRGQCRTLVLVQHHMRCWHDDAFDPMREAVRWPAVCCYTRRMRQGWSRMPAYFASMPAVQLRSRPWSRIRAADGPWTALKSHSLPVQRKPVR